MSMRILLLFPHYNTFEQASSLRSWQIARYLAHKGHEVVVFAPGVDMRTEKPFPEMGRALYWEQVTGDGVKVIRPRCLSNFRRSPWRRIVFEFAYAIMAFGRALWLRGVDVVVASYPPALMPPFGYAIAKMMRVPLVFEVRDLMASALVSTGYVKSRSVSVLGLRMERFVGTRAKRIIASSPGIQERLEQRQIGVGKTATVPHGYEPRVFEILHKHDRTVRQDFGWGDRFVAIYAGAVTSITDFETLFRVAARMRSDPEVLFVVVGEGRRREEYIELCRERGLDNVQFLGYQPRGEIALILAEANLGIQFFTSDHVWQYMLGSKIFDYLGSGIPALYAGETDASELIRRSGAGTVTKAEDVRGITRAIKWFKDHREIAAEMGVKGRNYIWEHYRGETLMADFEEVLLKAVDVDSSD